MPWQTQVVPILIAGNTYIDRTGVYIYNGTPAAGNKPIIAETAPGITKDPFGNSIQPGTALSSGSLIVLGTGNSYLQLAVQAGLASVIAGTGDASENKPGQMTTEIIGAGGTRQLETFVSSPQFAIGNPADIALISESFDGTVNSAINLDCANRINFGISQSAFWAEGTLQLNLPAAGGPFIFGESFHTVTNSGSFTGTMRVKKLPWNAIWLDVNVTLTGSTGGTFNFGNLPDATYYPASDRQFPLEATGVPTALAGSTRVHVPTSGAVQIICGSFTAGGSGMSTSVMYPTN